MELYACKGCNYRETRQQRCCCSPPQYMKKYEAIKYTGDWFPDNTGDGEHYIIYCIGDKLNIENVNTFVYIPELDRTDNGLTTQINSLLRSGR